MRSLLAYFADRHLLSNLIMVAIIAGGWFAWNHVGKEEMPDFENNRVSISVSYPGATAAEVEYFVLRPLEDALKGVDGIEEIRSSASTGTAGVNVFLDRSLSDFQETVAEIRSAVLDATLPDDIPEPPTVRQFKSSRKDVLDIALYDTTAHLLDDAGRKRLQDAALALEAQLMRVPEVSLVNRRGWLREEIRIRADPAKLQAYNLSLSRVGSEIRAHNQRRPAGSIRDASESKVTVAGELADVEDLRGLIVQGGFEGPAVRLADVAKVERTFEETRSIQKVNGHEAVILTITKNSSAGIVKAVDAAAAAVDRFRGSSLREGPIRAMLLDDESVDVRNRLALIGSNGAIGILLILLFLFVFLNLRAAFWVAFDIPFCIAFTLVVGWLLGLTVNNMTLAAVIIVLGMLVDDAIVVAENVIRGERRGLAPREAAVDGTRFVALPVTAAVITTCIAFLPLAFFGDRFGNLVKVLPVVISLMLLASLIESLFILPGHMLLRGPRWLAWKRRQLPPAGEAQNVDESKGEGDSSRAEPERHWFDAVENAFGRLLTRVLRFHVLLFLAFVGLLALALHVFRSDMKFVLFPNTETKEIRAELVAPPETRRFQTAELTQRLEEILKPYLGREVVGFRTEIARSRRGRPVEENVASLRIEIVDREKREKSVAELIAEWEEKTRDFPGVEKLRFRANRWGQESGSPIEILILENKDSLRSRLADTLSAALAAHPHLENVEIDRPLRTPEYKISLDRERIKRLGIQPGDIALTLRTILEGAVLYRLAGDAEEIYVVLTVPDRSKTRLQDVLNLPVENRGEYLVPLRTLVDSEKISSPISLERERFRRVTRVLADLKPGTEATPLEVAEHFEGGFIQDLAAQYPGSIITFGGEVQDTRESGGQFQISILVAVALIYALLLLLFNSLFKPLIIMLSIPFGAVGVIFAFKLHGMEQYGFFAAVGVLGLLGVVINDSIVMLVKLQETLSQGKWKTLSGPQLREAVAEASSTRLRAILLTTLTTVAGLFPTAYGVAGYDAMLAEMMLAMGWGLLFGTTITLFLVPSLYLAGLQVRRLFPTEGAT